VSLIQYFSKKILVWKLQSKCMTIMQDRFTWSNLLISLSTISVVAGPTSFSLRKDKPVSTSSSWNTRTPTYHSKLTHCKTTNIRTALGASSFSVTSPKIWNSLPSTLHSCDCPDTSKLITSTKPIHHPRYLPACILYLVFADNVCIHTFHSFTFLLTYNTTGKQASVITTVAPHVKREMHIIRIGAWCL